jgi:hypothetical protein
MRLVGSEKKSAPQFWIIHLYTSFGRGKKELIETTSQLRLLRQLMSTWQRHDMARYGTMEG